eukprot:1179293-Prorocentrum_minimum.AAC.2
MATSSFASVVSRISVETRASLRVARQTRTTGHVTTRIPNKAESPRTYGQHACREKRSTGITAVRLASQATRSVKPLVRCDASASTNGSKPEKGPVVVIDNYDSFTYNLCQYLGSCGSEYVVYKNDEITVEEVRAMNPRGILMSPGPGAPEDSGIALQTIKELGPEFPLFGVCMGHQCIGQVFGGKVVRAPLGVMHGKTSKVTHLDKGILKGLASPFTAARYHSLVIDLDTFPDELEMTAWTEDGMCMAVQHRRYPHIQGVQFHPESIITDQGMDIMRNFLRIMDEGTIDLQAQNK